MQEITADATIPVRLACGDCRHWEEASVQARSTGEMIGRCDRFGESRPGASRPRCNICWEPRTPTLRPIATGD
jgi:hypothetical protein